MLLDDLLQMVLRAGAGFAQEAGDVKFYRAGRNKKVLCHFVDGVVLQNFPQHFRFADGKIVERFNFAQPFFLR